MKHPNTQFLLAGILFVVIVLAASLGVAVYAEGETARSARWAFLAVVRGASLTGFLVTAIVMVRSMRSGFGIPRTAKDWNRFAKAMMGLSGLFMLLGLGFGIRTALFGGVLDCCGID